MRTKLILFLILAVSITSCAQGTQVNSPAQAAVAVTAVGGGSKAQAILRLYPAQSSGSPLQANLPAPGYPLGGAWSPDGRSFAFILIRSWDNTDIYVLDLPSGKIRQLTNTPACPEIGLGWTANSESLSFASFCRTGSQPTELFQVSRNGGQTVLLGQVNFDAVWAFFAPGATRVALMANRNNGAEIQVAAQDGSGLHKIASDASMGFEEHSATVLDWSPDGSSLVYATHPITIGLSTANQLVFVQADGSGRRVLVQPPGGLQCYSPQWAPDGAHLAFACGNDILSIQPDGNNLLNLTGGSNGRQAAYPAWAENGKAIIFLSFSEPGTRRVERIQADGSHRATLGEIQAGIFYGLAWQPGSEGLVSNSSQPAGSPSNNPVQAEPVSAWLIAGWLLVLLLLASAFTYRGIMKSAHKLPGIIEDLRSSERRRLERRQARRSQASVNTENSKFLPAEDKTLPDQDYKHPEARQQPPASQTAPSQLANSTIQGGIDLNSGPAKSLLEIGISFSERGQIEEAIQALRAYLENQPEDPDAWLWLGFASGQRRDWRTAESCFRRAGKLGSQSYDEAMTWLQEQRNASS